MRTAKQVEINTIGRDAEISTVKQVIDVEKNEQFAYWQCKQKPTITSENLKGLPDDIDIVIDRPMCSQAYT